MIAVLIISIVGQVESLFYLIQQEVDQFMIEYQVSLVWRLLPIASSDELVGFGRLRCLEDGL